MSLKFISSGARDTSRDGVPEGEIGASWHLAGSGEGRGKGIDATERESSELDRALVTCRKGLVGVHGPIETTFNPCISRECNGGAIGATAGEDDEIPGVLMRGGIGKLIEGCSTSTLEMVSSEKEDDESEESSGMRTSRRSLPYSM